MKERIILLIKAKNLTAAQFADEIGVQKSSISHIISGRNNASLDFIQKILLRYPEVNMNWILFGKGSIFKDAEMEYKTLNNNNLLPENESSTPPVDLFSVLDSGKPVNFSKEKELKMQLGETEQSVNYETVHQSGKNDLEKNIEQPEQLINKGSENSTFLPRVSAPKKIIKILEFYSDNTYREYYPEN